MCAAKPQLPIFFRFVDDKKMRMKGRIIIERVYCLKDENDVANKKVLYYNVDT